MKKSIFIFLMFVSLALVSVSCANSKTFTDKSGNQFTADPYG